MLAKNHLTLEQQEKLQKALKREENGDIKERILILIKAMLLSQFKCITAYIY